MARRSFGQMSLRAAMIAVLLAGCAYALVLAMIEQYRAEWRAEQATMAVLRRTCPSVGASRVVVGPAWLRTIAGPGRAKYFLRARMFFFTACGPTPADVKLMEKLVRFGGYMID